MREIKKIGPEIMDEYMYIYLNAYPAFKDLDEDCYKKYEAKNIRDMELDDDVDFYHLFTDPSHVSGYYIPNGYLQTNVSAICNMYKVMDPEAFVRETSYRRLPPLELTAAFEYHDEMADEEGRLTIRFAKDPDGNSSAWSVAKADETSDVTLRCMKCDLSSILMGSAHIGALIRLGVIETDKPEYTDMLDMLLYHKQRPFSNNDF